MTSLSIKDFDAAMNLGATSKAGVSKLVQAWEAKNNERTKRAVGLGLMAVSLAACGGSDDTPYSQDDIDALEAAVATAVAAKTAAETARDVALAAQAAAEEAQLAAEVAQAEAEADLVQSEAVRDAAVAANAAAQAAKAVAEAAQADAEAAQAVAEAAEAALQATVDDMEADIAAAGFDSLADLIAAYEALVNPGDLTFSLIAALETRTGGAGNDTFNAVNTATETTLTNLDTLIGGAGTDTLNISDSALGAYVLPTSITMTGVENISIAHLSDGAADTITVDVSNYADVDSVSIVNAGTDINTVTVTGLGNVQSVSISGGLGADIAAVTITDNGTAGTALVPSTDAIASISLTGLTGAATIASDALTSLSLSNVTGVATNTDGFVADARTLTVSLTGTNGGAVDAGATTVNFNIDGVSANAGASTFAAATVLNVDVNAALTAGSVTAAAALDVNVNLDADVTAMTIAGGPLTATLDFSGSADATITQTAALTAVITNAGTGDLTLVNAILAGQQYVGGAGVDTVTFAASSTTASSLGAGDDVATFAGVQGTGTVDAGAGTDTISLTAANAALRTATALFEASISNFERLSISDATAAATAVNLANLDDINHVTSAGTGGGFTLAVSGFQSGGTFAQTALLAAVGDVTLTGAFTGAADTFNLSATGTNGYANAGALTLAGVETVAITLDDSDATAATVMFDLNLDAVNATTITVSGDAGITFANSSYTALTTLDASGVTATGAAGVVTFVANNIASTITGGAGNDVLTGGAQDDVINGGAGNDVLAGGAGNDVISGGAGDDAITGGAGVDTLTGDAGADTFNIAADAVDVILDFDAAVDFIGTGNAAATYEAITDDGTIAAAADLAAATTAAFVLAAAANDAGREALGFTYGGDFYVAIEAAVGGNATGAFVAQVDDLTGLAAANFIA